jgi:small-conductance mechanosensitive channel
MHDSWIWAVGAVLVGVGSGAVGASLVRSGAVRGREDRPEIVDAARALAIFLFLVMSVLGVIVAVGVTNPDHLEPVPTKLLDYSPHALAAAVMLIVGRALGFIAAGYTYRGMPRTSDRLRRQCSESVRWVITAAAFVLALRQLGLDTTVLNIVAAAMLFGLAAAFALLVGLGGRDISREITHGRYVSRMIRVGDDLEVDDVRGTVVALLPASIAVRRLDGAIVHVPNTKVFGSGPVVRRSDVRQ